MLMRFLFGDDIFISYSRKDGSKYAAALANELSKPGSDFSCFLDQWGASAATKLSKPVLRALKRSSVMVLIGTAGAIGSPLVHEEVQRFTQRKWFRSLRPVLPINIDGALSTQSWSELTGLNRIPETDEARSDGVPSPSTIRLIVNSYSYTKRAQRTRWLSVTALLLLIASIVVGGFAAYQARRARSEEQRANAESQRANSEAQAARLQAEEARNNKDRADAEAERARINSEEAKHQTEIAGAKAREAEEQTRAAEENARTARSQELSAHAKAILPSDPRTAVLEAIAAAKIKRTAEAEDALRRTLLRFPEQTVLGDKGEPVIRANLSPDDRFVVTTSFDGIARVFETSTGRLVKTFEDARAPIVGAAITPNGKYLVLSGMSIRQQGFFIGVKDSLEYQVTQIRTFPEGNLVQTLHDISGTNISFSSDSRFAVLTTGTLERSSILLSLQNQPGLLDIAAGKSIRLPEGIGAGGGAIFTPSNELLIAAPRANFKNAIVQINVVGQNFDTLRTIPTTHRSVNLLPQVITSSDPNAERIGILVERSLIVCNSRTGQIQFEIKGSFSSAALSTHTGQIATGGDDGIVQVFEATGGPAIASFRGGTSDIDALQFTRDGKHIIVAGDDNVVNIWRLPTSKRSDSSTSDDSPSTSTSSASRGPDRAELVMQLTGSSSSIKNVSVSHNGGLILASGVDGTTNIWDVGKLQSTQTKLQSSDILGDTPSATLSRFGDYVVRADDESKHLWQTSGKYIAELRAPDPENPKNGAVRLGSTVLYRTGSPVLVQYDVHEADALSSYIEVYDSTGKFLASIDGSIHFGNDAAFSRDGKFIAVADADVAKIWSVDEKRFVKNLDGQISKLVDVAFSPRGNRIVGVGQEGVAVMWSFPSGHVIKKTKIDAFRLTSTGFSPDGRYVYMEDVQKPQWLWDTISHKIIALAANNETVLSWGFSNDSKLLFTSETPSRTVIYRTSDGSVVSTPPAAVVAFTPNGKFVVDSRLSIWDAYSGQLFSKPAALSVGNFALADATFTSDNQLIAVGPDGTILRESLDEIRSLNDLLLIAARRTRRFSGH